MSDYTMMFVVKQEATNRVQKREAVREIHKCHEQLVNGVEMAFFDVIFNAVEGQDTEDIPYKPIYEFYCEKYRKAAHWLNKHGKLKYIEVHEGYFMDAYCPDSKTELNMQSEVTLDKITETLSRVSEFMRKLCPIEIEEIIVEVEG